MASTLSALDRETQLLVAAGAAVAAGCVPCLETIVGMARAEGIEERKLKEAVLTGQYVKEQPEARMRQAADRLVGTHLGARSPAASDKGGCPLSSTALPSDGPDTNGGSTGCGSAGCACSGSEE